MKIKKKANKSEMARRGFLKVLGASTAAPLLYDPALIAVHAMIEGVIANAVAQETGVAGKNLVFIAQSMGPARWMYDLPVKLFSHEKFEYETTGQPTLISHPMVKTAKNNLGEFIYKTHRYGKDPISGEDYLLPAMWGMNIPQSNGDAVEWVPMTNLADNWLALRGLNMGQDGHELNLIKQLRPSGSAASVSGINADYSKRYLAAVHLSNRFPSIFKSNLGKNHYVFGDSNLGYQSGEPGNSDSENPIERLLSPFVVKNSISKNRAIVESAVKEVMASLADYAKAQLPGSDHLYRNYGEAESMIKKGANLLGSDYWLSAKKRYSNVLEALFNDNAPKAEGEKPSEWKKLGLEGDVPYGVSSFISSNTAHTNLYKQFVSNAVLTEFLINEKLSSSITFPALERTNLIHCDSHGTPTTPKVERDQLAHVVGHTTHFLMCSAVINELARGVGSDNWKNTVIQLGSEMGRSPRDDMEGSEHGAQANSTSIFSGCIKGPGIVGNIIKGVEFGNSDPRYATDFHGSWGVGAKISGDRSVPDFMDMSNQASTVCRILGVPSPTPNSPPMAFLDPNGVPTSLIGAPKTIQIRTVNEEEPEPEDDE